MMECPVEKTIIPKDENNMHILHLLYITLYISNSLFARTIIWKKTIKKCPLHSYMGIYLYGYITSTEEMKTSYMRIFVFFYWKYM